VECEWRNALAESHCHCWNQGLRHPLHDFCRIGLGIKPILQGCTVADLVDPADNDRD
jgi:hypothetical protein